MAFYPLSSAGAGVGVAIVAPRCLHELIGGEFEIDVLCIFVPGHVFGNAANSANVFCIDIVVVV